MKNSCFLFERYIMNVESYFGKKSAIIYMLISNISLCTTFLIVKILEHIPSFQKVFFRSVFMFTINYILIHIYKKNAVPKNKFLHRMLIYRGISGSVGLSALFFSISKIHLTETTVLIFTSPIWTGIMGRIFLKESYTKIQAILSILGFIGMVLIIRPPFIFSKFEKTEINDISTTNRLLGTCSALICSLCFAITYILLRKLKNEIGTMENVFFFSLFNTLFSPLGIFLQGTGEISFVEFLLLFLTGALSVISQSCVSRACQLEEPGKISVINYLQIVISYFMDLLILNNKLSGLSLLGTGIIVAVAILMFVDKLIKKK